MSARCARLLALVAAVIELVGGCGGASSRHFEVAVSPYVDVSLAPDRLHTLARVSGARDLTLAFVVAGARRCEAAWGGDVPITSPAVRHLAARTPGVAVSFGGQDGPDLATWCHSAPALTRQYERAIAEFHATRADFDIEGSALLDRPAIRRRARAVAALQAHARASGRPLAVSLTLPVEPTGLPRPSLSAVRSALAAGVRVGQVNLLAMDYGSSEPALEPGTMARYAISASVATARQMHQLLPAVSRHRIWRMIGITTMIGRNDVSSEIFTPTDARELLRFARDRGIGSLSFWSLARDRSCPHSSAWRRVAQDTCSGLRQMPFEFMHLFQRAGD